MKIYESQDIRNVALIGGAKSGKTTLAEAMAFEGGLVPRRGAIEDKNTISDYREIEIERGNSVVSTVLYTEVNNKKVNIIDCPGFVDFIGETVAALNAVECGVMVVDAHAGVDVGTEIYGRLTQKMNTSVIIALNQVDHEKANFEDAVQQLRESVGEKLAVVQYPVNIGPGFDAVIDLVLHKMIKFPKGGGKWDVLDIPESEKAKADEFYKRLVETAAMGADDLMEKYFETNGLTIEEMRRGIKLGLINRSIIPMLCISAKENMGVGRLLEFICNNVAAPLEACSRKLDSGKEIACDPEAPFSAFVFKSATEQHLGEISFMKMMTGELVEAQDIVNANTQTKDRVSQLFAVFGKNRQKLEKAYAGDIVATIKLKDTKTNHTLTSAKNSNDIYERIEFPDPIYTTAVKAVNSADEEKLAAVLNEMHNADPTLIVEYSRELKQLILKGQGEFHITTVRWYLDHHHKIAIDYFAPKIPYRETITKSAEAMYRHKKQSGGAGQFGEVHMLVEPYYEEMPIQTKYPIRATETHALPWGGKLVFNSCIVGGAIDTRFLPAILKGIMEKIEEGPLTGSYARDIVVNIFDGKMHPVDSNEMAFKLAGRNAFREAFKNAGPKILEPIYDIEVMVPSDRMGDVMTDLQSRRAIVMGMDSEGVFQYIRAKVPLAEMYRYSTALSSLTSGRASYSMKFFNYQQVPADVQATLLKIYEEQEKDEE